MGVSRIRSLATTLLSVLLLLAAGQLQATTVIAFSAGDLVTRAQSIMHVTCSARSSFRDDQDRIVTRFTFTVHDTLKGTPTRTLEFVQPGGEVAGLRLVIPGLTPHQVGDESVLFLTAPYGNDRTCRLPIGLDQGVYRVRKNAAGESLIARDLSALKRVPPSQRAAPIADQFPERVSLSAFKTSVRTRIQNLKNAAERDE